MKSTLFIAALTLLPSALAFADMQDLNERRYEVACRFHERNGTDHDRCYARATLFVRNNDMTLNAAEDVVSEAVEEAIAPEWANVLRVKCNRSLIYNSTARVRLVDHKLIIAASNASTPRIAINVQDRTDNEFPARLILANDRIDGECKIWRRAEN